MDVSRKLSALADPTRRSIFEAVAIAPSSVAELAVRFPVSRPAVSQHLKLLKDAGLVRYERTGTRNVYEVDTAGLRALRDYLDGLWSQALNNLKALAESSYARSKQRGRK